MKSHRVMAAALAVVVGLGTVCAAAAADLKVFGSRVTRMVIGDIGPAFERATGHKITVVTDVAAVMKRRILSGEPFDLAVLVDFQTDEAIKAGKLVAATRANVMKAGIGVAVRAGAARPDISTADAFTRTLLAAKSITYLKEGASTLHLERVFARLGIADAVHAKAVKPDTEAVSEMVANGEAELGIIVIPNILSVPGAELLGPIPAELQSYIVFTAAVSANSPNQQGARQLLDVMTSPSTYPVIRSKGMEPG